MNLELELIGGSMRPKPEWVRCPVAPGWKGASYFLELEGKPLAMVRHCGHPTALRPYYVVTAGGELERKYRLLSEAKAAALEAAMEGKS